MHVCVCVQYPGGGDSGADGGGDPGGSVLYKGGRDPRPQVKATAATASHASASEESPSVAATFNTDGGVHWQLFHAFLYLYSCILFMFS